MKGSFKVQSINFFVTERYTRNEHEAITELRTGDYDDHLGT